MDNQQKPKASPRFWMILTGLLLTYILLTQVFVIDISFNPKYLKLKKGAPAQGSSPSTEPSVDTSGLQAQVLPAEGVKLPIAWGNLGAQMIEKGVIDEQKLRQLFGNSLTSEEETWLSSSWDKEKEIVLNQQNSRFWLDLFWAFGLANKNDILENGEMTDQRYGGAGNFASTGGWTLAKGNAMDHYSKYELVKLTAAQQQLVDEVAAGIYRPCCGNPTHFPDCNHGMAMLGLLELMAGNGAGKDEMYRVALKVNSFWFPQTYLDLATYFKEQGRNWGDVDPAKVLGREFSSGQGYQATRQKIKSLPKPAASEGGCGA